MQISRYNEAFQKIAQSSSIYEQTIYLFTVIIIIISDYWRKWSLLLVKCHRTLPWRKVGEGVASRRERRIGARRNCLDDLFSDVRWCNRRKWREKHRLRLILESAMAAMPGSASNTIERLPRPQTNKNVIDVSQSQQWIFHKKPI